jgi:3alpha(or 20beta)-hydroxysteroid dehydrogenase
MDGSTREGRFHGRTVLVTGGARGMGAAIARRVHAEGAYVVVADVLADDGRDLVDDLGSDAAFVSLDVSREGDWAGAVTAARAASGAPVDVLMSNAGIFRIAPFEEMSLDDFMAVVNVNLVGTFLGIRAVIPSMKEAGRGAIVVNSSVDGLAAHPGQANYCASKAGILGLVRVASLELAPFGIRVNAVTPGAIDTPMVRAPGEPESDLAVWGDQVPMRRVGKADEVAAAMVFLASDDASYVSGTSLTVDGAVMAQVPLFFPSE